jgi:hypothetical protein
MPESEVENAQIGMKGERDRISLSDTIRRAVLPDTTADSVPKEF